MVYNYGLINEDVGIFGSLDEARRAFEGYTGFEWDPERGWKDWEHAEYDGYYE